MDKRRISMLSKSNYLLKFWKTSVSALYKGLWENYPILR